MGGVPFPRPVAGNPLESLSGAHTSLGQRFVLCFCLVGPPSYPLIRGCPSCEVLPRGALTANGMGLWDEPLRTSLYLDYIIALLQQITRWDFIQIGRPLRTSLNCLNDNTELFICQAFFLDPLGLFSVPEVPAAGFPVGVHLGESFFLSPEFLSSFPLGGVDFIEIVRHFWIPFLSLSGIIIALPGRFVKNFF